MARTLLPALAPSQCSFTHCVCLLLSPGSFGHLLAPFTGEGNAFLSGGGLSHHKKGDWVSSYIREWEREMGPLPREKKSHFLRSCIIKNFFSAKRNDHWGLFLLVFDPNRSLICLWFFLLLVVPYSWRQQEFGKVLISPNKIPFGSIFSTFPPE